MFDVTAEMAATAAVADVWQTEFIVSPVLQPYFFCAKSTNVAHRVDVKYGMSWMLVNPGQV